MLTPVELSGSEDDCSGLLEEIVVAVKLFIDWVETPPTTAEVSDSEEDDP